MTELMTANSLASGSTLASPPDGMSRVQAGPADCRRRILVAYSSAHGSTAGVARAIGSALAGPALQVDVRPMAEIDDPSQYHAVIAGSAIRYDKWLPEATGFVERHGAVLANRPLALFFVCMTLSRPGEAARRQAEVYAQNLRTRFADLDPGRVGGFAGALDYRKLPVLARPAAWLMFAALGAKVGDHRDWRAIESWAHQVAQHEAFRQVSEA